MARERTETDAVKRRSTGTLARWAVIAGLLASLVGVPAALIAEFEAGLLTALGVTDPLALGLFAMVPGFVLGGLAFVVMLGS